MDKFKKSRLETEDFANSFNFYRAGCKTKPVKNPKRRYPADGIP
ncbi:helix-turn-helix domain-containing protein, partial [Enterobacter hormaechei]